MGSACRIRVYRMWEGHGFTGCGKLNFLETAENESLQNALGTIRVPRVMAFYLLICAVSAHMPSFSAACLAVPPPTQREGASAPEEPGIPPGQLKQTFLSSHLI
jgi:hypothetical protein